MQIMLIPSPGATMTRVEVEGAFLRVNAARYELSALPETGPVRVEAGVVLVEYAKDGALAASQIGEAHDLRIVPVPEAEKLKEDPPTSEEFAAQEAANIIAQRSVLVCRRWQLMLVLGEDRWAGVEDFLATDVATWGMRQSINEIPILPRMSETADLLGYILDLDDSGMDDLWQQADAQVA